jgi:L-amino acid N-acyltransferase YncA
MKFIPCTYAEHATAILAIFNHAIATSTALYDYEPRNAETIKNWFDNKARSHFPVIGIVDENNQFMGFATYGTFRAGTGFKYSVEHSVYLDPAHLGKGLGKKLMVELIRIAKTQGIHTLIGVIDMENTGSIALHEKLGFVHAGTIKQAGYKFGDWRDCGYYQLLLATPEQPQEN